MDRSKRRQRILLVEPRRGRDYHTSYPPLGLLKLAAYHKSRNDEVRLVQGLSDDGFEPDSIYVTSLFTYAYKPVHEVIRYYSRKYPKSKIAVGGIYATICPEHLRAYFSDRIEIHLGLVEEAENILPDYSLTPSWNASILFASRGCTRKCPFCSVPKIEPEFKVKKSIRHLIYPGHKKVVLWDNNILASPYWRSIFDELEEQNLRVDFNQGLDARLLSEEVAIKLKKLKMPVVRMAYDTDDIRPSLQKAIAILKNVGIRGRDIIIYCLYNYLDTPGDLLKRIKDLLDWGVVAYPMRYEPLEPRPKNTYISSNWTEEQLEMIADARRVIGYGGAFPPYKGLKRKILEARDFAKAFELRSVKSEMPK